MIACDNRGALKVEGLRRRDSHRVTGGALGALDFTSLRKKGLFHCEIFGLLRSRSRACLFHRWGGGKGFVGEEERFGRVRTKVVFNVDDPFVKGKKTYT